MGLYTTVGTAAVLEDVSGNGPFSEFRSTLPDPPKKIWLPVRLGPGSRGLVPETVSGRLLGRPLEAATVSRWLEKLPRWFLEFFGSQLDPNLGSSWAPLGTPRSPKMQYVLRFFDVFAYSLLSTYVPQDDPKKAPRGPQDAPRGASQGPRGAQDGPRTAPRQL